MDDHRTTLEDVWSNWDLCRLICLLVPPKGVTLFMHEIHVLRIAGEATLLFLRVWSYFCFIC